MTKIDSEINIKKVNSGIILCNCNDFDVAQTLDCGQAFRWRKMGDGSYTGLTGRTVCNILQTPDGIQLRGVTDREFEEVWYNYFDLGRDYAAIKQRLSAHPVFAKAVEYAPGIRVLRQDSWEALCSFIISQNNHLKRIQGIVRRLCEVFGEPLENGEYLFPEPETLARASLEELAVLRAGFRARYLLDAARKVASGQVRVQELAKLPLEEARAELMKITGVGIKVAECTLLYGCGRIECFPVDVWIGRAMKQLFPDGLPACASDCAGIAQQYIFHYVRTCPGALGRN